MKPVIILCIGTGALSAAIVSHLSQAAVHVVEVSAHKISRSEEIPDVADLVSIMRPWNNDALEVQPKETAIFPLISPAVAFPSHSYAHTLKEREYG